MTNGNRQRVLFSSGFSRRVEVAFDEPQATSDGGALLLRQIDDSLGLTHSLAAVMQDDRCPGKVVHELRTLLRQRVFGIACGYADCNDAGRMASDAMHQELCGARGSLASQPTLSRFETRVSRTSLWRMGRALMTTVIAAQRRRHRKTKRITIDLDGTVDRTHGGQQHSLFSGFHGAWCYYPLLGFISFDDEPEQHLVAALLRRGTAHEVEGGLAVLRRLIPALRAAFPQAQIVVRLDAGFQGPKLFDLLRDFEVRFLVGLASNAILERGSADLMQSAREQSARSGQSVRLFGEQNWSARSWSGPACRVVYKAEVLLAEEKAARGNPRYVATNLEEPTAAEVYAIYCGRGDSENRIKELKDDLAIDRTSCTSFAANQLRVLLTAAAYVLYQELRCRITTTDEPRAQVGTLRLQLIKIGGRIVRSVRRLVVHLSANHPWRDRWQWAARRCGAAQLAAPG